MSHFVKTLDCPVEKEKYYHYLYDNIFKNKMDTNDKIILFKYVECPREEMIKKNNMLIQSITNHRGEVVSIVYYGNGYTTVIPPIMLNSINYNMILDYLEIYNSYNRPYYMETLSELHLIELLLNQINDNIKIIHPF